MPAVNVLPHLQLRYCNFDRYSLKNVFLYCYYVFLVDNLLY